MNSCPPDPKDLGQRAVLKVGGWESWLAQGRGCQSQSWGCEDPSCGLPPTRGHGWQPASTLWLACLQTQPPVRWTATQNMFCSLLPHPTQGLVTPLLLQQGCRPACHGEAESPGAGEEQPSAGSAVDVSPAGLVPSPGACGQTFFLTVNPGPLPGVPTRHPGPEEGVSG